MRHVRAVVASHSFLYLVNTALFVVVVVPFRLGGGVPVLLTVNGSNIYIHILSLPEIPKLVSAFLTPYC